MSTTGLDVFDASIQQTNEWLSDVAEELHTDNRRTAYQALRGTLHALRDNLVVDEAVDLAAQLPMLVRGFYFEGWDPSGAPVRDRDREAFVERAGQALERSRPQGMYPEPATKAVLKVLSRRVSAGEINEVKNALPIEIRGIWPDAE